MSMDVKVIEGTLVVGEGKRFAVVVSRFNSFITERLVEGADKFGQVILGPPR